MSKKVRSWKERIGAMLLAFALVVSWMLPNASVTAKAAGTADVIFRVQDTENSNALLQKDITITVLDGSEQVNRIQNPEADGTYRMSGLAAGKEYTYKVEKTGYEYSNPASEKKFTPVETGENIVKVGMKMSAIQLDKNRIHLNVGASDAVAVQNPVSEANYTWSVTAGAEYIIVSNGTITANAAGAAGDDAAKNATVQVSNGRNTQSVEVTINKNSFTMGLNLKEPDGKDQEQVVLTATGIPYDATGTLTFKVDGKTIGSSDVSEKSITYKDAEDLIAKKNFTVEYSGDTKYTTTTAGGEGNYTKTAELGITGEPAKELTYGAEDWNTPFVVSLDPDTIKGRTIQTAVEFAENGEDPNTGTAAEVADVAVVDNKEIKITPKNAGKIKIIITADKGATAYETDTAEYTLTVNRKTVSLSDITWDSDLSKVYDGTTGFELRGTITGTSEKIVIPADHADTQKADVTVNGENESTAQDVSIHAGTYYTSVDTGVANCRLVVEDADNVVKGKAIITHRPLYLTAAVKEVELSYGQNMQEAIEGMSGLIGLVNGDGSMAGEADTGLVADETVSELPGATLRLENGMDKNLYVNNNLKVIVPKLSEENSISGNYKFVFDESDKNTGKLAVTAQTITTDDLLRCIRVADGVSSGIYGVLNEKTLESIYASVGGETELGGEKEAPTLKLLVNQTSDLGTYYDQVFISIGEKPANATKDGISLEMLELLVSEETDKQAVSDVKVYLGKSGEVYNQTITNEIELSDWMYLDNKAPVAELNGYTMTAYSKMEALLTFGVFQKEYYTADIQITDGGSGISKTQEQQSYVWEMGAESVDLTKASIEKKILEIDKEGLWATLDVDPETGVTKIPVGRGENEEAIENNYLIFIRTVDNAGNCSVYVSNGIVIDVKQPTLSYTFDEAPVSETVGEDGVTVYEFQGSADYTLTITDPMDFFSSIETVTATVTAAGETITGAEGEYENSFVLSYEDIKNLSYEEMKDKSNLEIHGKVPVDEIQTNDVYLTFTATDKAGNVSAEYKQRLVMDKTAPVITVEYNEEEVPAKNGFYFNNQEGTIPRTMTIQYKERNMKVDAAGNYTGITFEVEKDGERYENLSLGELEAYGIKWDNNVVDEVNGTPIDQFPEGKYTEDRVCTVQLQFPEEGDYTIIPHCVDKLENKNDGVIYSDSNSSANERFVIDITPPEIKSVSYKNEEGGFVPEKELKNAELKKYSLSNVEAVVEIVEKNFWKEDGTFSSEENQFNFSATRGTDAGGKDITTENVPNVSEYYGNIANTEDNWSLANSNNENVWICNENTFAFSEDANYEVGFVYTDLAGNKAEYGTDYFTVDQTAPCGEISIVDGDVLTTISVKDFLNLITFNYFNIFKNADYQINLNGKDDTSGVKLIEYIYPKEAFDCEKDVKEATGWEPCVSGNPNAGNESLSGTFSVSPNKQFVVYERITDYAGHVTYRYPKNGLVADNSDPVVTITELNKSDARNGIYNEAIHLRIRAEDPITEDTYSGLGHVWYEVTVSGNTEYYEDIAVLPEVEESERYQSEDKRVFTRDIVIPLDDRYNSNDIEVQAHAEDFSSNVGHSEVTKLKMDKTAPTIDVQYDLNSPLNDRYYNATRTATVTVTERNFDPSAMRFSITNTDGTQPSISGWSHSANAGVSDSATHTCTVTFAADGDYTFTLNTTDLAGNASNYTRVDEFTIDQTDPTIQVSYDNNNDAEPGYFNADRTATITVNEHNFNASEVNTMITAALQGRGVATPGLGGWSTRGDVHTASVTFSADADYTFDVDYTDLAGNAAADYAQDSFTIDQTEPEVEFFDIEDKSANNDVVAPGVNYSDVNYTENGVEIILTGAKHDDVAMDGSRSSIPNGQSIKMADFERTKETDDLYTLKASITDRAGNKTEESVMFSVNRFGSVYILSEDTQDLVDNYYTNEEQDLVVTEINVDTLVFNGISYGRDGELVSLESGEDYSVKESGDEASWKQYQYRINKENFEEEGSYTVTIDSEDRATNVANNQVKGCDIEFAVDKTKPTVVIAGIEDGRQYRADTRDMTVNVSDNIAMGSLEVYVDNDKKPVETYSTKQIAKDNGEIVYTIDHANRFQEIKAVAIDAAGNKAETSNYNVLVTSNLLVQYYSNKPLFIGSILAVLAIAGGLWYFLIFAKRRKQEEE